MMRSVTLSILCAVAAFSAQAQTRYIDEVFTDAEIDFSPGVPYGVNIDFLTSDFSTIPPTIDTILLKMDVYQPDQGLDTETERPVILYLHTGNLLPPPINGSPLGRRDDSCAVETCRRMARRGYVAVSASYRGGWNPLAPTETERKQQLLNAVYRAIHDVKQCVRTMKADAAGSNTWAIDPDKIALWGEGTGGYIALAYVTLDDPNELFIEKFLVDPLDPTVSVVDTCLVGTIHGFCPTTPCSPVGCLNMYTPNGFDSEVAMCVNLGGALADTSWLAPGDAPMVTIHTVRDDFAPFNSGRVVVPTTGEYVVDLQGPNVFIPLANSYGNNDAFATLPDGDPFTDRARALYGTTWDRYDDSGAPTTVTINDAEGLLPIVRPLRPYLANEASPWQWWDPTSPLAIAVVDPGPPPITAHMASLLSNPDMSAGKGRTYLDTCIGYAAPRIVCAMQLGPCSLVGVNENGSEVAALSIVPNPATTTFTVTATGTVIEYRMYDVNGRLVRADRVGRASFTMDRNGLEPGAYSLQCITADGTLTRTVMFE